MCSIGTGAVCRWMGGQATQADLRFVRDSSCRTRDESGTARSTGEVWQTQIKVWNEEPPELWRALYLRLWVKRRHCESEEAMNSEDAGKQKDTYQRCGKDCASLIAGYYLP